MILMKLEQDKEDSRTFLNAEYTKCLYADVLNLAHIIQVRLRIVTILAFKKICALINGKSG